MPTFVVKERDLNEPCFVVDEESNLRFELRKPADIHQAEAVAKYLNTNVSGIGTIGTVTLETREGGRLIKRETISPK